MRAPRTSVKEEKKRVVKPRTKREVRKAAIGKCICGRDLSTYNANATGFCSSGCAVEGALEVFNRDKPMCHCGEPADAEDASIHCSFRCALKEAPEFLKSLLFKKQNMNIPSSDRLNSLWRRIDMDPVLATATVGIAEALESNIRTVSKSEDVDSICVVIASAITHKLAERYGVVNEAFSEGREKFVKHSRSLLSNLKKPFALEHVRAAFEDNDGGAHKLAQMDVKDLASSVRK